MGAGFGCSTCANTAVMCHMDIHSSPNLASLDSLTCVPYWLLRGFQGYLASGKYQIKEFMWNWNHSNPGQSLIFTTSIEVQLRKFTLAIHFIQLFSPFLCTVSFSKLPIMHINHKGSMVNHSNVAQIKPSNSSTFIRNLESVLCWWSQWGDATCSNVANQRTHIFSCKVAQSN